MNKKKRELIDWFIVENAANPELSSVNPGGSFGSSRSSRHRCGFGRWFWCKYPVFQDSLLHHHLSINQSTLNHNRVWLYMVFFYCRYFVHRAIVAHKRKLSFWRRHRRESQGRILPFSIMHKEFHFKSLFIPCVSLEWTPNYHPRTKRLHETQIVCIVTFRENTEL